MLITLCLALKKYIFDTNPAVNTKTRIFISGRFVIGDFELETKLINRNFIPP